MIDAVRCFSFNFLHDLTWHCPAMHMPLVSMKCSSSLSIVHDVPSRNLIDSIFPTSSPARVMFDVLEVLFSRDNDERTGVQNIMQRRVLNHGTVFHFVPLDFEFSSSQLSCEPWWSGSCGRFLQGYPSSTLIREERKSGESYRKSAGAVALACAETMFTAEVWSRTRSSSTPAKSDRQWMCAYLGFVQVRCWYSTPSPQVCEHELHGVHGLQPPLIAGVSAR